MPRIPTLPVRTLPVSGRWCLHSYYTQSPYAPDGSGRLLLAGAELERGTGEIIILYPDDSIASRFPAGPVNDAFYHTGYWQSWSPDGTAIYFQGGSLDQPVIRRRHLATDAEVEVPGDMEGLPPTGEPILSGLLGMLYAAGYSSGRYEPQKAPVPFQAREEHGIFEFTVAPPARRLRLSIADLLKHHPQSDRIRQTDRGLRGRLGPGEGATLMLYCVRWSLDGRRLLFYFGNHCVDARREEPKLAYVFTSDRGLREFHLAVDLSYGRPGVHWSWQPDGEFLIGYGPDPEAPTKLCLAEVRWGGTGYRKISDHASGGHPSISPRQRDLIVTDENTATGGAVVFISRRTGAEVARVELPKFIGATELSGRNARRICHHPVFSPDGTRVLCNTLPGRDAVLAEIVVPQLPL